MKEGFVSLLSLSKSLGLVVESVREKNAYFSGKGVVLVQKMFADAVKNLEFVVTVILVML